MSTLRQLSISPVSIPASTAWYLSDLGEFRGKQELYTRQSPQRLKESAIASTVPTRGRNAPQPMENILSNPHWPQ